MSFSYFNGLITQSGRDTDLTPNHYAPNNKTLTFLLTLSSSLTETNEKEFLFKKLRLILEIDDNYLQ